MNESANEPRLSAQALRLLRELIARREEELAELRADLARNESRLQRERLRIVHSAGRV